MKNVKTKSIHAKKSAKDGLRICVMRRIRPEYDFDMWLPGLAPSEKLLEAYVINKTITWKSFSNLFYKEALSKRKDLLKLLIDIAAKQKVTLLCGEKSARFCHRSLIIEECEKTVQKLKNPLK